jgi:lipase chaperone LimK
MTTFEQFLSSIKTSADLDDDLIDQAIEAVQEVVEHTPDQYLYALYVSYMTLKSLER